MDYCSILTPFLLKSLLILSTVNSRLANTPIIRTAAKSQAKINYRCLTEKQLPLLRTLANEDTDSRFLQ